MGRKSHREGSTAGRAFARRRHAGRPLLQLVLFLVLLRALIPPGYMPDLAAAQDGVITLVICSPDGLRTISLDENGNPVEPGEAPEEHQRQHCPFASVGSIDLPPLAKAPMPIVFTMRAALWSPQEGLGAERPVVGPVGSRAPPALS